MDKYWKNLTESVQRFGSKVIEAVRRLMSNITNAVALVRGPYLEDEDPFEKMYRNLTYGEKRLEFIEGYKKEYLDEWVAYETPDESSQNCMRTPRNEYV